MSYDIEIATQHPDGSAITDGAHVFIAGLARAGTTVLTRRFHASGVFGSLTYRDMPFVLAPGLWGGLSRRGRTQIARVERAHGDGLMIDAESPESLDEVFWRIFASDYLRKNALVPHAPDAEIRDSFRAYVATILQSRSGIGAPLTRYLSKTNNSILRIDTLRKIFPNALILTPFRDPLQHAASLLAQHQRFSHDQQADRFILNYMTWLGHHEFGLNHRPFVFEGTPPEGDPATLAYWLSLWCGVYEALLKRHKNSVRFISYDRLCSDPSVWAELATKAELQEPLFPYEMLRHSTRIINEAVPEALSARASVLHESLLAVC